jgi:hypothetical protein
MQAKQAASMGARCERCERLLQKAGWLAAGMKCVWGGVRAHLLAVVDELRDAAQQVVGAAGVQEGAVQRFRARGVAQALAQVGLGQRGQQLRGVEGDEQVLEVGGRDVVLARGGGVGGGWGGVRGVGGVDMGTGLQLDWQLPLAPAAAVRAIAPSAHLLLVGREQPRAVDERLAPDQRVQRGLRLAQITAAGVLACAREQHRQGGRVQLRLLLPHR